MIQFSRLKNPIIIIPLVMMSQSPFFPLKRDSKKPAIDLGTERSLIYE
jgi:hypothetical protein